DYMACSLAFYLYYDHHFIYGTPQAPLSPPFPYTTLFRSGPITSKTIATVVAASLAFIGNRFWTWRHRERTSLAREYTLYFCLNRSEEHTSELQSRENLVCRLLLEKKKIS